MKKQRNRIFQKENDTSMYSTYNKGKSAVVEGFIRTLKDKNDGN